MIVRRLRFQSCNCLSSVSIRLASAGTSTSPLATSQGWRSAPRRSAFSNVLSISTTAELGATLPSDTLVAAGRHAGPSTTPTGMAADVEVFLSATSATPEVVLSATSATPPLKRPSAPKNRLKFSRRYAFDLARSSSSLWLLLLPLVAAVQEEAAVALWSGTNKNRDVSTRPLACLFARSLVPLTRLLAPPCLLLLRAPLRSLVRSLAHFAHSPAHGKVNY